jgi:hypothetical protein
MPPRQQNSAFGPALTTGILIVEAIRAGPAESHKN